MDGSFLKGLKYIVVIFKNGAMVKIAPVFILLPSFL